MDHWIEICDNVQVGQLSDVNQMEDVQGVLDGIMDGFTVLSKDGEVLACIGVREIDEHNATAWAMMRDGLGARMAGIHKCVTAWLDGCGYANVYADVRDNFTEGHRWAKLLGFKQSGIIANYYDNGDTAIMYRREQS